MFITVTSAKDELSGVSMVLNTEYILSMFRNKVEVADKIETEKTFIFCPPHGTWEVQETPDEILELIAAAGK